MSEELNELALRLNSLEIQIDRVRVARRRTRSVMRRDELLRELGPLLEERKRVSGLYYDVEAREDFFRRARHQRIAASILGQKEVS